MADKVTRIFDHNNNSKSRTVEDTLRDCLEEGIDVAGVPANKALVILLNDENEGYAVGFHNAGMKMSEAIALLEVMKVRCLNLMGFIPEE